jgi:Kef-type K+ transport system membrane component KefB
MDSDRTPSPKRRKDILLPEAARPLSSGLAAPYRRTLRRVGAFALVALLMAAMRARGGAVAAGDGFVGETSIVLGFLLLATYLAGSLAGDLRLPRITGYILAGMLVGPSVLHLIQVADVAQLKVIDDIAISLIALSAGGELRIRDVRRNRRMLFGVMGSEMTAVFLAVGGFILLAAQLLPFTAGATGAETVMLAIVFGAIAIANSPAVAIAVVNDAGARGPVASTVLSVTILKDVAVIVLFAGALAIGRVVLGTGGSGTGEFLRSTALAIPGSIAAGAAVGWLVALYLRHVGSHLVLFTLAVAFVNAQIAAHFHFEVLLLSLSVGFFVENISPVQGEPLIEAIEKNSTPLYALFFGLAGASLGLAGLASYWYIVVALVLVRAAAILVGVWLGARLTDAHEAIRRYAWTGFISQAGITLGMVVIAARAFPQWADLFATLFVAMVAIHELAGPVLLQDGLRRAGEIGKAKRAVAG